MVKGPIELNGGDGIAEIIMCTLPLSKSLQRRMS